MAYYYVIILLLSFFIPLLYSFHPKTKFYKHFRIIAITIPLTSIPFIIWDFIFTKLAVWGFNNAYVSNIYFYNLPIEEILFFMIIPFCCLYTYFVIEKFNISLIKVEEYYFYNIFLAAVLFILSIYYIDNSYTFLCFFLCSVLLLLENVFFNKINYNYFYTTFFLIMIPFIIVNGALTGMFLGQIVVWYNPNCIIGLRLFTIPIEDSIYAFQLILSNLFLYKYALQYTSMDSR